MWLCYTPKTKQSKNKKLNIQKMKIMASRSYHFMASRWGNNCKQWQTLFSWAEKKSLQMVTTAMKLRDACSLEGKLWQTQTVYQRDITLPTKIWIVKAIVFPVVTYGCESWTIKKDKHRRIDALELWCWRRLLRVLWTARRSNQSILKEINPAYSP